MKCQDCNKQISKVSIRCKSCSNKNRRGKYHSKESYRAIHYGIRLNKPKPEFCEKCKKRKPYDVANISGEYERDINDFRWLCRSCHMKEDGRLNNLKQYVKM